MQGSTSFGDCPAVKANSTETVVEEGLEPPCLPGAGYQVLWPLSYST